MAEKAPEEFTLRKLLFNDNGKLYVYVRIIRPIQNTNTILCKAAFHAHCTSLFGMYLGRA